MSAGAALRQVQLAFAKGVLYLDGSWQTLVESLLDAALQASVAIATGTKIERIKRDAGDAARSVR